MTTDIIEKTIVLRASRARVWRALTSSEEFGRWFGARFEGEFVAGQAVRGTITNAEYKDFPFEMLIDRIDAERLFSFRWHPDAVDLETDYSAEPTTLVEFRLEDAPEGTTLTMRESGFDALPADRRREAFVRNEGGWTIQVENIRRHVEG